MITKPAYSLNTLNFNSYRCVFLVYVAIFILMTFSYWGQREVISPYGQQLELGLTKPKHANQYENRKFSDFSNGYIPEITAHLHTKRSGWLALWSNDNELGRPLYHISGFSPAYVPMWVMMKFTKNPWRLITLLSLTTCFLAGLFIFLFCREVGQVPLAGLIAGTSLAASPLFMYWLTFPMFSAVWCWAAGILWGLTRMAKKPDLIAWVSLALIAYCMLMTAYPQPVVYQAYILCGYGLHLIIQNKSQGLRVNLRFVGLTLSALLVGGLMSLPVYLDLMHLSAESARRAPDLSFFTTVLTSIYSLNDLWRFLVVSLLPELFGHPIRAEFPLSYDGLSITILVLFFASICILTSLRETWGWWLAVVVCVFLAFKKPVFEFAVQYLGFNFSRTNPLGSIMLPLTVIMAYGVDALVMRSGLGKYAWKVFCAASLCLLVLLMAWVYGIYEHISIHKSVLWIMLVITGLLMSQALYTRTSILLLSMLMILGLVSYPLMLHQPMDRIALTSPLVEKLKENLASGTRYAVASPGISVLPPSLNASLAVASLHSYNSLSSRRYHALVSALGGETTSYGRWNASIYPDYNSTVFWMSNIGVMLSPNAIQHDNLKYIDEVAGVKLYQVLSRMGESLQVQLPASAIMKNGLNLQDPRQMIHIASQKVVDQGDVLQYAVAPMASSVLILSQKYHRDWHASALDATGWKYVKTVVVNGVFQGVVLPSGAKQVRLEFQPYARWVWVSHAIWWVLWAILAWYLYLRSPFNPRQLGIIKK